MASQASNDDQTWRSLRDAWSLRDDTIYLNHGSFGPPPDTVREARLDWLKRLDEQPMDFFVRQLEPELYEVRDRLARFHGTKAEHLVLVDNATYAMNVVAGSFSLSPGDEVLLTDHEYGAVSRVWERACQQAGTGPPKTAVLPSEIDSAEQVVDAIFSQVNQNTRLLVVSHITSLTAITLPITDICRRARAAGVAVCIDGPHAVAQLDVQLDLLDCDFYTGSCHKWLSAPLGTGFLYVHPRHQENIKPPILSWGRLLPNKPTTWHEEFTWLGTQDLSRFLAIPAAIDFLETVGLDQFRQRTHSLARYARHRLIELTQLEPIVPDSDQWYGCMAHMPLPPGDALSLQASLWTDYGIEIPIIEFNDRRFVRVSCHLYTQRSDIDQLVDALALLLDQESTAAQR